jgi:DnaD/phage-associated family protein
MPRKLSGFIGFPDQKMKAVVVPDLFFADLLPQIDDMAELKLTLHCFWLLNEQSGDLRYVRGDDLRADDVLLASLNLDSDLRTPAATLEDALERAVGRNTLLRMQVESGDEDEATTEDWYFMNTVKGRQTVAAIRQGRLSELQSVLPEDARLRVERPNLFVMYEQNIGMMTPLIADQLRDMEKSYPPEWIDEAFDIAVSRNKRALRYIHGILKRWETEGKDEGDYEKSGRSAAQQPGKPGQSSNHVADEWDTFLNG